MANNQQEERHEVRGPTSALTSFLRSKNIRVPNANRFRRRGDPEPVLENGREAQVAAVSSAVAAAAQAHATPSPSAPSTSRRSSTASRRPGASMNFAEDDDEDDEPEQETSLPRKKVRTETESDRGEGSSRGGTNGSSVSASAGLGTFSLRQTATGAIDFCAKCGKRFTITAYTVQTHVGGLCHRCGPLHGKQANGLAASNGFSGLVSTSASTSASAKRVTKPRRKPNQNTYDKARLPSLQSLCINIIADNIEHVEALMGIGGKNMNSISKSISKNRRLTSQTMMLFLQPMVKQIAFYDCSQLDSDALSRIAGFCPYVEEINLQQCGMLDNEVIDTWGSKMTKLSKIELFGPFLVRVAAWHRFFETTGKRLTSFKIRESPRFDKGCCEMLVKHCPNVTELGLAQIGPLNAECLAVLKAYGQQLTYLDISDPGVSAPGVPPKSLRDDEVIDLLNNVGARLNHLDISRNADLTSKTLLDGILANCISLQTLNMVLMQAEEITSEHFVALFRGLKQRGGAKLSKISLERCTAVDDEVIDALVEFCGANLVDLNVNSCDKITVKGLERIAQGCPNLIMLDVGFCRQMTDVLVMDMINNLRQLRELWLFSCNKLTPTLFSNRVRLIGLEKYGQEV